MNNRGGIFGNYDEIGTMFARFLLKTYQDIACYDYVSITERRFFNLFYLVFSDRLNHFDYKSNKDCTKLLSNNGLLLIHHKLAEQYLFQKKFPHILLVDDLAIHGRNIGKFLFQLEQAIIADVIRKTGPELSEEDWEYLHSRLVEAIDIRVFAASMTPLLLEDSYAASLKSRYQLYGNDLHWVTDFLSQIISSSPVANTSFVLSSYRCVNWLTGNVSAMARSAVKEEQRSWKRVEWVSRWRDDKKNLVVYMRPRKDKLGVYLISTVRFYEGSKGQPLTSYPIFGNIKIGSVEEGGFCCVLQELSYILSAEGTVYSPLCEILNDSNVYVQQAQGQLMNTFLSIADLAEFCKAYHIPYEDAVRNSDMTKLLINYGAKTHAAFHRLIYSPRLLKKCAGIIRNGLRQHGARLNFIFPEQQIYTSDEEREIGQHALDLFGQGCMVSAINRSALVGVRFGEIEKSKDTVMEKSQELHDQLDDLRTLVAGLTKSKNTAGTISPIAFHKIYTDISTSMNHLDYFQMADYVNDKLERIVYYSGMQSEAQAYDYIDVPFLYNPSGHDNYVSHHFTALDCNFDNTPGVISFNEFMSLCPELPVSGYGRTAAYLVLVDKGCIAGKIQYVEKENSLYSICKAGERALFYLPQRLSVFIPALSIVEKGCLLLNLSAQEAVSSFVHNKLKYAGNHLAIKVDVLELQTFIHEYMEIFSRSGQMFSGWNFSDLTKQHDPAHLNAQKEFIRQAEAFLNE